MTQQTDPTPNIPTEPPQQSLFARLAAWLSPPVFPEDEIKTRQAAILNTLLIAAVGISFLNAITLPWSGNNILPVALTIAAVLIVVVYGMQNIRDGHVERSIHVLTIFGWLLIAGITFVFGGVSSPVFASFIAVILLVGLLLGYQIAIIYAAVSILYGGFLIFMESSGALRPVEISGIDYLSRFGFIFVIATFIIFLVNRFVLSSVQEANLDRRKLQLKINDLDQAQLEIEEQLKDQSLQLDKRSKFLEAAAQIAKATTSSTNLSQLLDQVVNQIAEQFGYYHVGIFVIDQNSQWAVLSAASSEGGQQMIARDHRLGVGKQGIVGFVTGIGQARITQDIGLDRIHSVTKELPDTRSEMALPLKVQNEIIGALDIQDAIPNAFLDEDVAALEILSNQIALGIANFRLAQESQERFEEIQRVYGEYSQRAWAETHWQKSLLAYQFSNGDLIPISTPDVELDAQNKIDIPILVRGNRIGVIEIAREDPLAQWTDDEMELLQTLSDQLGIALDSARLFNESQLRATTEKVIGDINAEIWESLEINSILKTTVEKLQQSLELPEVSIKMTTPDTAPPIADNGAPAKVDESN